MPFARVASHRIEYERIEARPRALPDARLPARGSGLGGDVARFSGPRRACHRLQRGRRFALRLRPLGPARRTENGPVHARRGADGASRTSGRASDRAPDSGRAQRWRLDRTDLRGGRSAAGHCRCHAGGARAGRGHFGREHRRREINLSKRPTSARSSRATTTMSIPHSGAGTGSGWRRNFATGTSRNICRASRARCSRSRARTTNTGRWNSCIALAGKCATSNCWRCGIAAIRRTGISRRPSSAPSPASSIVSLRDARPAPPDRSAAITRESTSRRRVRPIPGRQRHRARAADGPRGRCSQRVLPGTAESLTNQLGWQDGHRG